MDTVVMALAMRAGSVLLAACVALAPVHGRTPQGAPVAQRQVAITIDDLPVVSVVPANLAKQREVTRTLLAALTKHHVPAIGFVNEAKLVANGMSEAEGTSLLEAWLAAGMALGNHTYAHVDFHTAPLDEVESQVVRGERVTRELLSRRGTKPAFFRHPYLHAGRSLETRQAFEAFLAAHGYRVAPVTIDNYDYLYAAALDRAIARKDRAMEERVLREYPLYMERAVAYYEQQSTALFGREIPQVLLIHASTLNARSFDALARTLERRAYMFVPLEQATADPAYQSADTFVGPGGPSWIHRWALTAGKRRPFFDGEPEVPEWIVAAGK
jgi:peptidoglycan/xylan/chitin deacetylase (PgdA/CDA1 family)